MRITLVTSAHVANNPRLVKEADALARAGHVVTVVAPWQRAELAARDDALITSRPWTLHRVRMGRHGLRAGLRWIAGALVEKAASRLFALGAAWPAVTDRALTRNLGALLDAARAQPADVVVGHNLQALPVAARTAHDLGARLAFDVEDLHTGELPDEPRHAVRRALVADVERRYLPRCHALVASSEGIADEIVKLYRVRRPLVVHNTFPLSELDHVANFPDERPAGARVSLYWYSQVIGEGRGLEDAVRALARCAPDVHLTLRGEPDRSFLPRLEFLAREVGVERRVHFRAPVVPSELVPRAARHDIGLALEQPVSRNRQICVTNKIFTYMLAGLAVAATETEGQRAVLARAPDAGFLYAPGDAPALAAALDALAGDPRRLEATRRAARRAAESTFSWETESARLVAHLTAEPSSQSRAPDGDACAR